MKKRKPLIYLLLILLLTACGKQEIPTDFGDDSIADAVSPNDDLGHSFFNPILYIHPDYSGFIYCLDFETGESYPLCSKPNCFHNSEDCNAYRPGFFYLYEDRIISVDTSLASGSITTTWSLRTDGSGGEILGTLIDKAEFQPTGVSGGYSVTSHPFIAYRGYIYCGFEIYKEGKQISRLYRLPTSGGSSEIVWEQEFPMDSKDHEDNNMFLTYCGLGNKVYFVYHHGPEASSLYSYNIETGEVSLLRESQPRIIIIYFAYGKWYYETIYGVYCWNPKTGEERCLVSLPTNPYVNGRSLRFYERGFLLPEEDDPDMLAFYDWDGNVTHRIKIDALPSVSRYLLGHSDNYILFQYGNKSTGFTIAALDANHLDDPSPEWILFEFPTE